MMRKLKIEGFICDFKFATFMKLIFQIYYPS